MFVQPSLLSAVGVSCVRWWVTGTGVESWAVVTLAAARASGDQVSVVLLKRAVAEAMEWSISKWPVR